MNKFINQKKIETMIKVKSKYFNPNKVLGLEVIKSNKGETPKFYVVVLLDTIAKELQKQFIEVENESVGEAVIIEVNNQLKNLRND